MPKLTGAASAGAYGPRVRIDGIARPTKSLPPPSTTGRHRTMHLGGATPMDAKTIVIAGGGFAGTTLARALDGKLPPSHQLLVISEESYTTFNPMLPETLGASIFPEQVVAPIRQMLNLGRFIMGRVNAVDTVRRTLTAPPVAADASPSVAAFPASRRPESSSIACAASAAITRASRMVNSR